MSVSVTQPTTIGTANTVGGVGAMRVRLLSNKQFLTGTTFDVAGTGPGGAPAEWVEVGTAVVTRVLEPENIFGRYALEVDDDTISTWEYVYQAVDMKTPLNGNTFVLSAWMKATGADTSIQLQFAASDGSQVVSSAAVALTRDNWTHVVLVATISTATAGLTTAWWKLYPAAGAGGAADLGTIRFVAPRLYIQREELTAFPLWPLRDWTFDPFLTVGGRRDAFAQLHVGQPSVIPRISARHPVINKAQIDAVNAIVQHDGALLVEPTIDSEISFLMVPGFGDWAYRHLAGRAIGYSGAMEMEGLDPVFGIPGATRYYEDETGRTTSTITWAMRIKP